MTVVLIASGSHRNILVVQQIDKSKSYPVDDPNPSQSAIFSKLIGKMSTRTGESTGMAGLI